MAKKTLLPIMFGVGGEANKCIVAGMNKEAGADAFICWIKPGFNIGDKPKNDDLLGTIAHLHFCNKESLKAMIDILQGVYEKWDRRDNDAHCK